MNTILDYLTIDILTMYKNNIKLHYVEYVERYVNVIWKKKFIMNKIKKLNITQKAKEQRVNNLCNQIQKIKTDLLNIENINYKSHSMYHKWINQQKQFITPNKATYKKNNIVYDLICNPMDYFPCMIFMMKLLNLKILKLFLLLILEANFLMVKMSLLARLIMVKVSSSQDLLLKRMIKYFKLF